MSSPLARLKESLSARGVRFLFAQFTDIHGAPRGKLIPLESINLLFESGAGFAGPSIPGTSLPRFGPSSEYFGRGDVEAVTVMPWLPGQARVVCDGYVTGMPFPLCPRQLLRRQIDRLASRGFTLNVGIEPEFFLLSRSDEGRLPPADRSDTLDKPSYDYKSISRQRLFFDDLVHDLQESGLDIFQIDHEDACGQFEVNWRYGGALRAADDLMLFKMAAHTIAERHGYLFSMMPKPFTDRPGSGMHFHLSLSDSKGGMALADPFDPLGQGLSALGYAFLGGLLHHAMALSAFCAPTVNSYKRLVSQGSRSGSTWAPTLISYGYNNRTTLARIVEGRIEWRLPDASANPYVALAGVMAAFMDGIEHQLEPGAAMSDDLYELSSQQLKTFALRTLPRDLHAALCSLEADKALVEGVGAAFCEEFIRVKRTEWDEYTQVVHPWEAARYAGLF